VLIADSCSKRTWRNIHRCEPGQDSVTRFGSSSSGCLILDSHITISFINSPEHDRALRTDKRVSLSARGNDRY